MLLCNLLRRGVVLTRTLHFGLMYHILYSLLLNLKIILRITQNIYRVRATKYL